MYIFSQLGMYRELLVLDAADDDDIIFNPLRLERLDQTDRRGLKSIPVCPVHQNTALYHFLFTQNVVHLCTCVTYDIFCIYKTLRKYLD